MITIVKIGGAVLENEQSLNQFILSFSQLKGPKVLVHGGGKTATQLADKLDIPSNFIVGRRITDQAMLDVVVHSYSALNTQLVAKLKGVGCLSLGITGASLGLIESAKRPVNSIDYGFVGDVKAVDATTLLDLMDKDLIPVISPITADKNGQLLNTNADTIAAEIAKAIAKKTACKLVYAFEQDGVLGEIGKQDSLVPELSKGDFTEMVMSGAVSDGMVPKLTNAMEAKANGVSHVSITSFKSLEGGTLVV